MTGLNQYNTVIFNASPHFSSASGDSTLEFGNFAVTIGVPVQLIFNQINYVKTSNNSKNYLVSEYKSINYIYDIYDEV